MTIVLELRTVYCPDCEGRGRIWGPVAILGLPAGYGWYACSNCNGIGALDVEEVGVLQ